MLECYKSCLKAAAMDDSESSDTMLKIYEEFDKMDSRMRMLGKNRVEIKNSLVIEKIQ